MYVVWLCRCCESHSYTSDVPPTRPKETHSFLYTRPLHSLSPMYLKWILTSKPIKTSSPFHIFCSKLHILRIYVCRCVFYVGNCIFYGVKCTFWVVNCTRFRGSTPYFTESKAYYRESSLSFTKWSTCFTESPAYFTSWSSCFTESTK